MKNEKLNNEIELEFIKTNHLIYIYIIFTMIFITFNYFAFKNLFLEEENLFVTTFTYIVIFHILFLGFFFIFVKKIEDKETRKKIEKMKLEKNDMDKFLEKKKEENLNKLIKYNKYKFEDFDYIKNHKKYKKVIQKEIKTIQEKNKKDDKYNFDDLELDNTILELDTLDNIEIDNEIDGFDDFVKKYLKINKKEKK